MSLLRKSLNMLREEGATAFIKKALIYITRFVLNYSLAPIVAFKVKSVANSINDIYTAVNTAYTFKSLTFSMKPAQIPYEITKLLEILSDVKPKTILEIGTARGGTLFLFAQAADPEATIISIDLPGGPFGGGYPLWRIPIYKAFAKRKQRIYLVRGDSHDPKTLEKVQRILGDRKLDFLFIDADHTYEGVKKDFEMYSPLVREGGIIAFHDIVPHDRVHDPEDKVGVPRFWNEIKYKYKYLEIVQDWNQGWAGIGIIYK